jgi:hypothetical protein
MDSHLDVFEEGKTFAPLDDLVEAVVGDAAQTRDGIAFGGRPTTTATVSVAVIVPSAVTVVVGRRRLAGRR